ncbi:Mobile element protein [Dissulfuribacter thermophilus]|uniref:Mobile element protein n=1 Tax=Dissulfuribacter thermophilus TaxID=1156395 RepID=A0A1B9F3C8_9BACT|nr:Mobile element protein [Dissulfuribacter thermophilus]
MKCKREFDGRKLDHKTLEAIRMRAVQQVLEGKKPEDVADFYGMNHRTIYRWLEKYHYGGFDALKAKPVPGRPPKLNASQLQWLARALRDKDPRQLNFPFALWTLAMVKELIFRKFGVSLSEVSVGRILKTLGFSPQRPLYRATQRDKALVNEWKTTEYPKIKARAKKEGAVIFFGDESGVRSDYHRGTMWGERGKPPVVKSTGACFSLNMISAISPRGHFRFMTVKGSVTAEVFCDFLKRLVNGMDQKIFLMLDNHRVHHSKKVRELVSSLEGKLEIFYLPPYSPDLNPDEQVWNHVKRKVSRSLVVSKEL